MSSIFSLKFEIFHEIPSLSVHLTIPIVCYHNKSEHNSQTLKSAQCLFRPWEIGTLLRVGMELIVESGHQQDPNGAR